MDAERVSEEVLVARGPLVTVSAADIAELKAMAEETERGRIRLCAHRTVDDPVHEMIIVHPGGAYVRPHRHRDQEESYHILEGEADFVSFGESGTVECVVSLGDFVSGKCGYLRTRDSDRYHTILIRSDVIVFHETTRGPFDPSRTEFPEWAPEGTEPQEAQAFLADVERRVAALIDREGGCDD